MTGSSPATVPDPPNLTVDARYQAAAALPLNIDRNPSQVRSHAVMLDHGYKSHGRENIKKNTAGCRLQEAQRHDRQHRESHGRHHRPVPIRPSCSYVNIDPSVVHHERVHPSCFVAAHVCAR